MTWWKALAAALCGVAVAVVSSAKAAGDEFPFDSELILDVDPMPGSKRIPNMDVAANGAIAFEMWCHRVEGQFVVAGDTVSVLTGRLTERTCPPARSERDTELLSALTAVTNWRRDGTTLLLIGPRTLRFRLPTN